MEKAKPVSNNILNMGLKKKRKERERCLVNHAISRLMEEALGKKLSTKWGDRGRKKA